MCPITGDSARNTGDLQVKNTYTYNIEPKIESLPRIKAKLKMLL